MMKYIRWQGALTFVLVIALFVAFFYLFAGSLIKTGIEKGVSLYTGAEVNVADVDVTFSPLSLTVKNFQATDPELPEQNIVAFEEAQAGVDFWQYLLGKVIIDSLEVKGLTFASVRTSPGDVYLDTPNADDLEAKEKKTSELEEIKNNLPDPKELLNNSDLLTVKASQALSVSYKEETAKLKNLKSTLPTKERLSEYQDKVKALGDVKVKSLDDLAKLKAQYDDLKTQFKADKAIVKSAKDKLSESKKVLSARLSDLKTAPGQDWKQIEKTYQLENLDGADFAHMLFGEQARDYYDIAETAYQKLAPLMAAKKTEKQVEHETAKGRFVFFAEENPLPELLIKKAHFSVLSPQGDFKIDVVEFTHQHWLRNKPTTYSMTSTNVLGQGQANLEGDFVLDQAKVFTANGDWKLTDVLIENAKLKESENISLTLAKGLLFANGHYQATNDKIDSENKLIINQASYNGKGDSHLAKLLVDTVSSVDELALTVNAAGPLSNPDWEISSPLDKALKNSLNKQVDQKLAAFKTDVKAGLNDKLTDALGMQDSDGKEIAQLESLLSDSDKSLESLLNSDIIKQKEDELKDKAKDKVKDKLKSKLGKFFD